MQSSHPGIRGQDAQSAPARPPIAPLRFQDVTQAVGIHFRHNSGAFGRKWYPETNGAGCAIFDYDGDGWPDLFFVNGRDWTSERRAAHLPLKPGSAPTTCHLYHNNGDGTFTDVTRGSGLEIPMYGMGAAVGDYDNDGRPDLFVTAVGANYLFHNDGGGHFTEVSRKLGLASDGWGTSATWVDYDRDGLLDLFVCHYVRWRPRTDNGCEGAHGTLVYCGPNNYAPEPCRLYHQNSNGTFTDVSRASGIWGRDHPLVSKAMGVVACDVNGDGWPDLVVTNDTEPNFLFMNQRNGSFSERAVPTGIAFSDSGAARSGMGVDAGDFDNSGRKSILIGNFATEMMGLYRHESTGLFSDVATKMGVGKASEPFTTFGCLFVDLNNDGWLDIAAANGHIDRDIDAVSPVPYQQQPLFLINHEGRQFTPAPLCPQALIGRGLAAGDLNRDGAVDLVLTTNGGNPVVLYNVGGVGNSLRLVLEGTRSIRCAIGAEVIARIGHRFIRRTVRSGCSYLSASELAITLGIGSARQVDEMTIRWPSAITTSLSSLAAGREYQIKEGIGVTRVTPFLPHWRKPITPRPTASVPRSPGSPASVPPFRPRPADPPGLRPEEAPPAPGR